MSNAHHNDLDEATEHGLDLQGFRAALSRCLDRSLQLSEDRHKHRLKAGIAADTACLAKGRQGGKAHLHDAISSVYIVIGNASCIDEQSLCNDLEMWRQLV